MNNPASNQTEISASGKFKYLHQKDGDSANQNIAEPPLPEENPNKISKKIKRALCVCIEALLSNLFSPMTIKRFKIGLIICLVIILIDLGLSITLVLLFPSEESTLSPGTFQFMSSNLMADPIMDLKIVEQGSSCPAGLEPLTLSTWPGIVAGCFCENQGLLDSTCKVANSKETKFPGRCDIDIPKISPIKMHHWGGSTWCGKRALLGTDYVKKTACPKGYYECYPGGCFVQDCPITHVELSPIGTTNKLSKAGADGKERYLILTRKQGEMPLIDFHITPNDVPCFNQQAFDRPANTYVYPLLDIFDKDGCGKYGLDTHFSTKLDSQSSNQVFAENSFPKNVLDLPHFEEISSQTLSVLSYQVRMKTAKQDSCLNMSPEYTNNVLKPLDHLLKPFRDFLAFQRFAIRTFIFLIGFLFAIRKFQKKLTFTVLFNDDSLFSISFFMYPCQVIIQMILFFALFFLNGVRTARVYLEVYDSLGCFLEGQGNQAVSDHWTILKNVEICRWLLVSCFILNIVAFLFWILNLNKSTLSRQSGLP